jgi:hypothetical protein
LAGKLGKKSQKIFSGGGSGNSQLPFDWLRAKIGQQLRARKFFEICKMHRCQTKRSENLTMGYHTLARRKICGRLDFFGKRPEVPVNRPRNQKWGSRKKLNGTTPDQMGEER